VIETERKPVKHIVLFKYKAGATPDQIDEVTKSFKALKDKIPGIVSFEYGVNSSPENLNKGFTHVYLVTFENAEARDAYLPHPEHQKFGELLGKLSILDEAFVVDFQGSE
jgi:Stress responsive A/B Barrel Domain